MGGETYSDANRIRFRLNANGPTGTFTCGASATTTVNNTSITSNSLVFIQATNAAAAALQGSAKHLYVSALNVGSNFIVSTGSAVAAAGTESFNYWVVN